MEEKEDLAVSAAAGLLIDGCDTLPKLFLNHRSMPLSILKSSVLCLNTQYRRNNLIRFLVNRRKHLLRCVAYWKKWPSM